MSYLFSRALVEAYSRLSCLDGGQSPLSKNLGMQDALLFQDRTRESFKHSRYGMTFALLTEETFEELPTSLPADFHAKPIPRQLREKTMQMISGRKCDGSWQMSLPGTYLQRTLQPKQSTPHATTLKRWVTKPEQLPLARKTWVLTMFGKDHGYLHTPTTKANYCADSMQKWPCSRNFKTVFGKPTPMNHEWLMGWPIGWSGLKALETDKFQSWRSAHSFVWLKAND